MGILAQGLGQGGLAEAAGSPETGGEGRPGAATGFDQVDEDLPVLPPRYVAFRRLGHAAVVVGLGQARPQGPQLLLRDHVGHLVVGPRHDHADDRSLGFAPHRRAAEARVNRTCPVGLELYPAPEIAELNRALDGRALLVGGNVARRTPLKPATPWKPLGQESAAGLERFEIYRRRLLRLRLYQAQHRQVLPLANPPLEDLHLTGPLRLRQKSHLSHFRSVIEKMAAGQQVLVIDQEAGAQHVATRGLDPGGGGGMGMMRHDGLQWNDGSIGKIPKSLKGIHSRLEDGHRRVR